MSFDSFPEFIAMGGHGLYVWLCYGVGFFVLLMNALSAKFGRRKVIRELAQRQRRDQALANDGAQSSSDVGVNSGQ